MRLPLRSSPWVGAADRATPGGRVAVYETRDGGASWTARGNGLPQKDSWLTILRQAFGDDGDSPQSLAFGSTSGSVFASGDGGTSWTLAFDRLPQVTSVRFA